MSLSALVVMSALLTDRAGACLVDLIASYFLNVIVWFARDFPSSRGIFPHSWHATSISKAAKSHSGPQISEDACTRGGLLQVLTIWCTTVVASARQLTPPQKDGFVKIALTVEWLTGAADVVFHWFAAVNRLYCSTVADTATDRQTVPFGHRRYCGCQKL